MAKTPASPLKGGMARAASHRAAPGGARPRAKKKATTRVARLARAQWSQLVAKRPGLSFSSVSDIATTPILLAFLVLVRLGFQTSVRGGVLRLEVVGEIVLMRGSAIHGFPCNDVEACR